MIRDVSHASTPIDHGWLSRERSVALALVAITVVVIYLCYRVIAPFLPALAWALALAVIVHPLHLWMRSWMRWHSPAAALSVVLVGLTIIVPVTFVTHQLVREARHALGTVQGELESSAWRARLEQHPRLKPVASWVEMQLGLPATKEPETNQSGPFDATSKDTSTASAPQSSMYSGPAQGAVNVLAQGVSSVLSNFTWLAMQLCIALLALFFFFRDREQALQTLRSLMPLSERETDDVFKRVTETIHATIYGSLIVALVQGTMGGLMFWWLELPSPLFWGAVMALLAVVPMLGTFVVWSPTAAVLALQGNWTSALALAAWGGIAIALIDNALNPFLVGKRLRFHTLLVFIALVGGLAAFGASGIILGPLLLAISDALLDVWRRRTAYGGTVELEPERQSATRIEI